MDATHLSSGVFQNFGVQKYAKKRPRTDPATGTFSEYLTVISLHGEFCVGLVVHIRKQIDLKQSTINR